jgi:hypothetical protein
MTPRRLDLSNGKGAVSTPLPDARARKMFSLSSYKAVTTFSCFIAIIPKVTIYQMKETLEVIYTFYECAD